MIRHWFIALNVTPRSTPHLILVPSAVQYNPTGAQDSTYILRFMVTDGNPEANPLLSSGAINVGLTASLVGGGGSFSYQGAPPAEASSFRRACRRSPSAERSRPSTSGSRTGLRFRSAGNDANVISLAAMSFASTVNADFSNYAGVAVYENLLDSSNRADTTLTSWIHLTTARQYSGGNGNSDAIQVVMTTAQLLEILLAQASRDEFQGHFVRQDTSSTWSRLERP